jgi:pyruvate/2-oxoglutarate dehydrogenase complex dihydrolipoamide dehydrogenase (E3) component
VLEGTAARFLAPDRIEIGDRVLTGRRFLIATGSRPAIPPIAGLEETGFYTHESAFEDAALPGSVVILGGGPIGIEFAQAYGRLGVQVTLVELAPRILPNEDAEPVTQLEERLRAEGIRILTGHAATAAERRDGKAALRVAPVDGPRDGEFHVGAERIFVAVGRSANVEELDLGAAGVETDRDGIRVDRRLRTTRRHIFAAGDVTGGLRFTHVAEHEARSVLRNALFPFGGRVDYSVVPWTIFTDPPLARVGLTEEQARARHRSVKVYRYDTADLDRVITDRESGGLVKLITDGRGRLLGGHVLAPSAGTMIVEVALAMRHGLGIADLSALIHPYPTMSEGIRRTADMYYRAKLTDRSRTWLDRYFRFTRGLRS